MSLRRPEDERMCETSEPSERLISADELLPVTLEISRRILEVFGYQQLSNMVFRLRSNRSEIDDIVRGRSLPSSELLLGIRRATGVSIDWLLTGEGQKFPQTAQALNLRPTVDAVPFPEPRPRARPTAHAGR